MKKNIVFAGIAISAFLLLFYYSQSGIDKNAISFTVYPEVKESDFRNGELTRIGQIHSECFEPPRRTHLLAYYSEVLYPGATDYQVDYFKQKIEGDILESRLNKASNLVGTTNMVIMRHENKVVGMYSCNKDDDFLENDILLANVCVATSYRGKGLGKMLTQHAIDYCRKLGSNLYLTVYQDEPWNIEMYKKLGFEAVPYFKEPKIKFVTFHKILMKYRER